MSDHIDIDGKKYISAKKGAELTGYTTDYIGQLARGGKVATTLVGRARYVDEDDLLAHYTGKRLGNGGATVSKRNLVGDMVSILPEEGEESQDIQANTQSGTAILSPFQFTDFAHKAGAAILALVLAGGAYTFVRIPSYAKEAYQDNAQVLGDALGIFTDGTHAVVLVTRAHYAGAAKTFANDFKNTSRTMALVSSSLGDTITLGHARDNLASTGATIGAALDELLSLNDAVREKIRMGANGAYTAIRTQAEQFSLQVFSSAQVWQDTIRATRDTTRVTVSGITQEIVLTGRNIKSALVDGVRTLARVPKQISYLTYATIHSGAEHVSKYGSEIARSGTALVRESLPHVRTNTAGTDEEKMLAPIPAIEAPTIALWESEIENKVPKAPTFIEPPESSKEQNMATSHFFENIYTAGTIAFESVQEGVVKTGDLVTQFIEGAGEDIGGMLFSGLQVPRKAGGTLLALGAWWDKSAGEEYVAVSGGWNEWKNIVEGGLAKWHHIIARTGDTVGSAFVSISQSPGQTTRALAALNNWWNEKVDAHLASAIGGWHEWNDIVFGALATWHGALAHAGDTIGGALFNEAHAVRGSVAFVPGLFGNINDARLHALGASFEAGYSSRSRVMRFALGTYCRFSIIVDPDGYFEACAPEVLRDSEADSATTTNTEEAKIENPAITQQVIIREPTERVIERVVTPASLVASAGVTQEDLQSALDGLNNSLRTEIYRVSGSSNGAPYVPSVSNFSPIALSNNIDQLSGVTLTNVTFSGSVSGLSLDYLPLSGGTLTGALTGTNATFSGTLAVTASTTFNGIEYLFPSADGANTQVLTTNGAGGLSWSTVASGGSQGSFSWLPGAIYNSTTTDQILLGASSTTTTSKLEVIGDGYFSSTLSVASTSPWGLLSVNPNGISGPAFVVGSSTATSFVVDNAGNVVVGNSATKSSSHLFSVRDSTGASVAGFTVNNNATKLELNTNNDNWVNSFISANVATALDIGTSNNYPIRFCVNQVNDACDTSTSLIITTSNNIGIGTTSPYAKLSVVGPVVAEYFHATSTTATSTFVGAVGIGTTSPWGLLSVNPNGISGPAFVVGSSTATNFIVDNAGNVGIGTTNPSVALEVSGVIRGNNGNSDIVLQDGAGNQAFRSVNATGWLDSQAAQFFQIGGSGAGAAFTAGSGSVFSRLQLTSSATQFNTAQYVNTPAPIGIFEILEDSSVFFSVLSGGNVGIGTTSPYAKLSVVGPVVAEYFHATSSATSTIGGKLVLGVTAGVHPSNSPTLQFGDGDTGIHEVIDDQLTFVTGGAARFDILSTGVARFSGDIQLLQQGFIGISGSTRFNYGAGNGITAYGDGGAFANLNNTNSYFTSNLGIGTTSPYAKLSVVGPVVAEYFHATSTTATSTFAGAVGIGTTSPWRTFSVTGTVSLSSSLTTGTTGNYLCINTSTYDVTSGTTCSASSARFKENIENLAYGLDAVRNLRPVTFNYKKEVNPDTSLRIGFIAEEVVSVVPEVVTLDKDGNPEGVAYDNLVPVLVNALQEIDARLAALESGGGGVSQSGGDTLSSLRGWGIWIGEHVASFKDVIVARLTVGSRGAPAGITLYDETTGEPYCVMVSDGVLVNRSGACADLESGLDTLKSETSNNENADTVPPVITILGNNPAEVEIGASYVDLGATALDDVDGERFIDTLGDVVDTSTDGTHIVTYTARDVAGNTATGTRTVIVGTGEVVEESEPEPEPVATSTPQTSNTTPPVATTTPQTPTGSVGATPTATTTATSTTTPTGTTTPSQ